jgi:hypothetical protein
VTTIIENDTHLEVGQKVQIDYPNCPSGWNVVGTVLRSMGTDYHGLGSYIVVPDSGVFEGIPGGFLREYLKPIQDAVTVEDVEGLDALPLDTRIEDIDGDVFTKMEEGRYQAFSRGYLAYDFTADELEESLPGIVLNPELMGEFRALPTELDGFSIGDSVVVVTGSFLDIATPGTAGVVKQVIRNEMLNVTLPDGLVFPFRPDELAHAEPALAVGVVIETVETLDSLPDGTVLSAPSTLTETRSRVKVNGDWLCPSKRGTYNHSTRFHASQGDLRVAYLPE